MCPGSHTRYQKCVRVEIEETMGVMHFGGISAIWRKILRRLQKLYYFPFYIPRQSSADCDHIQPRMFWVQKVKSSDHWTPLLQVTDCPVRSWGFIWVTGDVVHFKQYIWAGRRPAAGSPIMR